MISCVSDLIATATGPSRLRSELRSKTKPMSSLLIAINAPSCVKTSVPVDVFGGDIFSLFSKRLQEALQYVEEPKIIGSGSLRKSQFPVAINADRSSATNASPSRVSEPARSLKSEDTHFVNMAPSERFSVSDAVYSEEAAAFLNLASIDESKEYAPIMLRTVTHKNQLSNQAGGSVTVEPKKNEHTQTSILVEKLREYWELSQREQQREYVLNQKDDICKETGKNISSSISPPATSIMHSWPEITEQQISQKIRSIISGQEPFDFPEHAEIQNNLPGKVEVKNVFNIDMKASGSSSINDLSEKIVDILREQALQHGIDIT